MSRTRDGYTAGPWPSEKVTVLNVDEGTTTIASVCLEGTINSAAEVDANQKLVNTAPELYETMGNLRCFYCGDKIRLPEQQTLRSKPDCPECHNARVAHAKARGE